MKHWFSVESYKQLYIHNMHTQHISQHIHTHTKQHKQLQYFSKYKDLNDESVAASTIAEDKLFHNRRNFFYQSL